MRRRRGQAGYTMVELMMALVLLAIGVAGIIAMQKVTVTSNAHAKNLAVAQRIAQAWTDQLAVDATGWQTTLSTTTWLAAAGAAWSSPAYNAAQGFGPAFDALGAPLNPATGADRARFCVNLRVTPVVGAGGAVTSNGVLRAEVRVYWLREGLPSADPTRPLCGVTLAQLEPALQNYHVVYQATGVRQHPPGS